MEYLNHWTEVIWVWGTLLSHIEVRLSSALFQFQIIIIQIFLSYTGILRPIKMEIAMKFTMAEKKYLADQEYQMYSYLGAINDTNVERYGIPVVYYYGNWNQTGLILMAVSLLDQDIEDLVISKRLFENDVNILILLRDFVS